jgi:putative FmdB family regulatory protein
MPIFEYRCAACGNEFELLVLPRSTSTPECPACQGQDLEKLFSGASVSTDHSRRKARRDGKARGARLRRDLNHEEHKRIHDHSHDHD